MILMLLMLLFPASALAEDPACWLQDSTGNKFAFTHSNLVWIYEPKRGSQEACAYGIDMDKGAHTITCSQHKIDAVVYGRDGGARILNREWTRSCGMDAGL